MILQNPQASQSKHPTNLQRSDQHDPNQFLTRWFAESELIAAKSGKHGGGELVWRFPVQKEYLNGNQQYSGGAQAAVHDCCTGWTLLTIARPDFWATLGSTRTLNMSYLRAPAVGDILRLDCKVSKIELAQWCDESTGFMLMRDMLQILHLSSRMVLIQGVMTRESDGKLISMSEHHLVNNTRDTAKL